jgi:hypothetical protein
MESEVGQFFDRAAGSVDNPGGDTFGAVCPQCGGGLLQLTSAAPPDVCSISCSAFPACRNQRVFPRATQAIAISATATCPNPACSGAKLLEFSFRRSSVRAPPFPHPIMCSSKNHPLNLILIAKDEGLVKG